MYLQVPEGFQQILSLPCSSLTYNSPGSCFACLEILIEEDEDEPEYQPLLASIESVVLKFRVKDCDPNTQEVDEEEVGYEDEYALENVDFVLADYMQRIVKTNFAVAWDSLGKENEVEEVYQLSTFKTINEAVRNVVSFMGMQPCERSDRVSATSDGRQLPSHTLLLAGVFKGVTEVLIKSKLAVNLNDPDKGVTMQISARSNHRKISDFIASSVA